LLKYIAFKVLTIAKEFSKYTFFPKYIKPSNIFFDKNFEVKVEFLKVSLEEC